MYNFFKWSQKIIFNYESSRRLSKNRTSAKLFFCRKTVPIEICSHSSSSIAVRSREDSGIPTNYIEMLILEIININIATKDKYKWIHDNSKVIPS